MARLQAGVVGDGILLGKRELVMVPDPNSGKVVEREATASVLLDVYEASWLLFVLPDLLRKLEESGAGGVRRGIG